MLLHFAVDCKMQNGVIQSGAVLESMANDEKFMALGG